MPPTATSIGAWRSKPGLTAGVTAGLTNLPVYGGQSLNQLAGIQTIGGQVIAGNFNSDEFTRGLLAMAGSRHRLGGGEYGDQRNEL